MKPTIRCILAVAAAYACMWSAQTCAQDILWTNPSPGGSWTNGSNWNLFALPDPDFDGRAVVGTDVGSGAPTGEANVTSNIRVSNPAPSVVLGNGANNMGTLNISASGAMAVVSGTASVGNFDVGLDGGMGVLNVAGILEVEGELRTGTGAGTSTITFSGSADVTADSGFTDRNFIVDGANVSASFTNDLILGGSGTHTWRIPAAGASTISVGGNADLGGTLRVEFPDGAPTVGSTWNLIDSATVDALPEPVPSGFNNIDQSSVGVGYGQKFVVNSVAGGNGVFSQLSLEQHPVLVVDRATGTTAIKNFGTTPTVSFDTYVVGSSTLGSLDQGNWSSLSSSDPNSGWVEARPTVFDLSELNVITSTSLAGDSMFNLGNPITIPTPTKFGQETEDIRFRFAKPTESVFTEGTVVYTGVPNNTLTLNVDPSTGEAQILNGTGFTVSIEAYVISSANDSLEFDNGTWNSLEDQGASGGAWYEANISESQISELLVTGEMVLAPNAMVPLGSPFAVGDIEDLVFQFAVVEDDSGDFNQDGTVDGDDFLEWQRNPAVGALSDWEANYGNTGLCNCGDALVTGKVLYSPLVSLGPVGAVTAVPEPSTLGFVLVGISVLCGAWRRSMKEKTSD